MRTQKGNKSIRGTWKKGARLQIRDLRARAAASCDSRFADAAFAVPALLGAFALATPLMQSTALAACTLNGTYYSCSGNDALNETYNGSGSVTVHIVSGSPDTSTGNAAISLASGDDLSLLLYDTVVMNGSYGFDVSSYGTGTLSANISGDITSTDHVAVHVYAAASTDNPYVVVNDTAELSGWTGLHVETEAAGGAVIDINGSVEGTSEYGVLIESSSTGGLLVRQSSDSTVTGRNNAFNIVNDGNGSATTIELSGDSINDSGDSISIYNDVNTGAIQFTQYEGKISGSSDGIKITNVGRSDTNLNLNGEIWALADEAVTISQGASAGDVSITTGSDSYINGHSGGIYILNESATGGSTYLDLSGEIVSLGGVAAAVKVENDQDAGEIVINQSGSISSSGYGIYANNIGAGATTVIVDGSIEAANSGVSVLSTSASAPVYISVGSSGSIQGDDYGLILYSSSGSVVNVYGRIESDNKAIYFASGDNILNIYNGSSIVGVVDFNNAIGNTTNFYTGSYTLSVLNYDLDGNTINLLGSAKTLVTSGIDSSTNSGDIVVIDTSTSAASFTGVSEFTAATLGVVASIADLDVDRPMVGPGMLLGYADEGKKFNPTDLQAGGKKDVALDGFGNLVWVRALGAASSQDSRSGIAGYNSAQAGLLGGIDHRFDDWRLGIYGGGGLAYTSLSSGIGSVRNDLGLAGIYARRNFGKAWVDFTVAGGHLQSETRRSVNGGAETATGKTDGWFGTGEVAVSTRYDLGSAWSLAPSARLRYSAMRLDGYSETGSSQNVSYDDQTSQSLEGRLEAKLVYAMPFNSSLPSNVWLKGGILAREAIGPSSAGANVLGADFTVETVTDRHVYGATLGAGFDMMISERTSVFGALDGTVLSNQSQNGTVRGGVKIAF